MLLVMDSAWGGRRESRAWQSVAPTVSPVLASMCSYSGTDRGECGISSVSELQCTASACWLRIVYLAATELRPNDAWHHSALRYLQSVRG